MYFSYFVIWKNLNPLHVLCAKFGWNQPSGSEEKDFFLNSVNVLHVTLICYYLPLENDVVLHLNTIESPSPKDVVY